MKKIVIAIIAFAFCACQQDKEPKTENTTIDTTTSQEQQEKVDLTTVDFEVSNGKIKFDDSGMPTTSIYIYPSDRPDSLFLAEDVGAQVVDEEYYDDFDIPADAAIAIRAYYAGGGNHYYGMVNNNQLIMYKTYIPEMTPDNEDEFPETFEYERFKTYTFFENEVVTLAAN